MMAAQQQPWQISADAASQRAREYQMQQMQAQGHPHQHAQQLAMLGPHMSGEVDGRKRIALRAGAGDGMDGYGGTRGEPHPGGHHMGIEGLNGNRMRLMHDVDDPRAISANADMQHQQFRPGGGGVGWQQLRMQQQMQQQMQHQLMMRENQRHDVLAAHFRGVMASLVSSQQKVRRLEDVLARKHSGKHPYMHTLVHVAHTRK